MYSDSEGHPILRESFASYIDELGTKEAVLSMTDEDLRRNIADQDQLRSFLDPSESRLDPDHEFDEKVLTFSDNIVIGAPVMDLPEIWGDRGLFWQVSSLSMYLLNQALRKRFFRGGVALGQLYMDHSYVAGPALIQAVLLEEKVAIFPRVVLSEDCSALAREHLLHHSGGDSFGSPYNSCLLQDQDGLLFVNYLGALLEEEAYEDDGSIETGLADHRDAVLARAAAAGDDPRITAKYRWLVDYHNWVATEFYRHPEYTIDANRPGIRLLVPRP